MKRKILLSGVLASILFLSTGCNGGGQGDTNSTTSSTSTTNNENKTVSGTVADGHIKGATVCIDLNGNNKCDIDEPTATSNLNGNYTINTDKNISGKDIIASGGFDIGRNAEFNSTLVGYIDGNNVNITPLTTITTFYAQEKNISFDEAKQDIASSLGINVNDIGKDPTVNNNLQKISLQLELAVETAAKLENKNSLDICMNLAKNASPDKNMTQIIDDTFTNPNIKTAVNSIINYVDNNSTNLQTVQNEIINTVSNAIKNNIILPPDSIENTILFDNSLNELNLSFLQFNTDINSLFSDVKIDANNLKTATTNDAKTMVQTIRNTTYEFLDPNEDNQENNSSTLAGEMVNNYNKAIKPAINNLNDDINTSINNIDEATKQFNKDVNNEFNESITNLNNRLEAITNVLNEHNSSDEYNATTDYNDTISHTYSKADDGYITETFKLDGKTLTAKYYENQSSKIYVSSDPVSLSKDGEYEISLDSLSVDNDKYNVNLSGVVYDTNDTSKKIDLKNATLSFDLNSTSVDNTLDPTLAFSNIDLNISADVTTQNGTFNGDIVFNNGNKYLTGELDYTQFNGVKLNGNLVINASTNDLLKIANDDDKKYDGDHLREGLVLVNGSLVTKSVEYNWTDDDSTNTHSHEENLTSITGEVAHCTITDTYGNNFDSHTVNCDKNVTSYDINDKMVRAEINGTNVALDDVNEWETESDENSETYGYYYDFYDASDNDYYIMPNTTSDEMDVTDIKVENPTTALDVAGNIKFSGIVTTPKVNVAITLTAQSDGDGKIYHVFANDVNITDNNDFASVNYLEVTQNKNSQSVYPYYSNYVKNYDQEDGEKTTQVLLQGLNATLYDTNNNPIKLQDMNVLADINNKNGSVYGNLSYLDFNMTGFIGYQEINDMNQSSLYLNIQRDGYEPFLLASNAIFNDNNGSIQGALKEGNYTIYLNQQWNDENSTLKGYDSNGVFINVTQQGDNDENVTITDKKGNSLAKFDPKTDTVTYNDNSSETLY